MSNLICNAVRSNIRILNQIHQKSNPFLKQNIYVCNARYVASKTGNHRPNTLEKYMLVWMKKFPSVAEVPSRVSADMMEKTRNWVRIKVNIIACFVTIIGCLVMIYSGKQAAKRGESVAKMNIKWHEEQNAKKD